MAAHGARGAASNSQRFGIDVDPMSRLGDLPIGLQQLIEIARVLFSGARIIILDEPTSALSPPEVERLFATLKRLRDEGTSIVFISHFIEDILRVSDTVTVFRNGRKVAETAASETSKAALIEAMIGKGREALEETYSHDIMLPPPTDRPVVLNAERAVARRAACGTSRSRSAPARCSASTASWDAGSSSWRGSCSASSGPTSGTLAIAGDQKAFRSTAGARRAGHRLRAREPARHAVPPGAGLQEHLDQHPRPHLAAAAQAVARARDRHAAGRAACRSGPPRVELDLGMLSGGNQQKVALAKWLSYPPRLLVLCEPTRGMDVGAKNDVIHIVRGPARPRGSPSSCSRPSPRRCCRSPTASSC